MKNLKRLIFSFVTIYIASTAFALAEHKSGHASVFKVIMRKVELCTGSTPNSADMTDAATCLNPVVIGSGDKEVDVASVGAGSVAASYGNPALFPLGETYTHMRVTMDKKMTVKGFALTGTGNDVCRTQTAGSSANYPGGSISGNERNSHKVSLAEGEGVTLGEQDIYNVYNQYTQCTSNDGGVCSASSDDQDQEYPQGTGSSLAQSQHADLATGDDHIIVYAIDPYTVGLVSPKMDISFGTQAAIGASDTAAGFCSLDTQEPVVTISIK
jgi:hypothetical protein